MKSSSLPLATLAALLCAALLTSVAGVRMARVETVERTQVGREEVADLSADMMAQLARLDRLYESHLRQLAQMDLGDRFELRRACDQIVGVRQIALAVDVESGARAEAFQENFEPGWRGLPMLPGQPEPALRGDLYPLPAEELASAEADQGWLQRPGEPLMYWHRRAKGIFVVVTPDPEELQSAIHGWLGEWVPEVIEPVAATRARVRIAGVGGEILSADELANPDLLVPLKARFGTWKVAAWDERELVVGHHTPTLVATVGLAGVFVLLGIGGYFVLRRALRLSEQRVSFVNRVSHELRTPLTNILLNNDLAASAVELGDEAAASGRLELVREEAGRLSRLIANVLTFSRAGETDEKVAREVFSLAECVERTLAPFRASLQRKGFEIDVEVDDDLRAVGDFDLAAQVLANLISNVEKYAAAGGLLAISASGKGEQVQLRVVDAGPGIPAPAEARVFEAFVRLNKRVDEGVCGTGLGLSIARDLAEKMGGGLRLERSEVGAQFVLTLSRAPENIVEMEGRKIS